MKVLSPDAIARLSVAELEAEIRHHNKLYFEANAPEISDEDFDRLTRRLQELAPRSAVLHEIPSEGSERAKAKHRTPMLSLEKAYTTEDVEHWATRFTGPLLASPKIDGLAIELRYDAQGHLYLAVTRGDGFHGDVITENIRHIENIPASIPEGPAEIRGEVYLPLSIFQSRYAETFASPRNLAAGALKQKDPTKTATFDLAFFAYDLLELPLDTEVEKHERLHRWGFSTVPSRLVEREEIETTYHYFQRERENYDYALDGVVFKANLVGEQQRLGLTAHHPRASIAYKFQGDVGVTRLHDVEWSVARSGVITPIGLVEPVVLSGASVSRVSLHNYGLMQAKQLRRGALVQLVRSGGVIPYLQDVVEHGAGEVFEAPRHCPSCGAPTEVREDFLYCTNPNNCVRSQLANLEHFVKTVEIEGLGPKVIAKLYEQKLLLEPTDFYRLRLEDLEGLERMGPKLATKLIRNIQTKRTVTLDVFIAALGIRGVGPQVAQILTEHFPTWSQLTAATPAELEGLPGLGPITAQDWVQGAAEKTELIEHLLTVISLRRAETARGPLQGKSFCFTGQLEAMPRSDAEAKVKALGGVAKNQVTKDLAYLVLGAAGGGGSKLKKAQSYQADGATLQILSEAEFLELLH